MTVAYAIGLALGALFSAFVVSRVLLWAMRRWFAWRPIVANSASFIMIVCISGLVREGVEWPAMALHLIAQSIWLCYDLWRVSRRRSHDQLNAS
ncbi:hypothetical protein [Mesorhizobium sp. ES1-1]|uniref:hypothetical protein n=1 Tax=Mesorhizobium sp. ES1-1 TaxID=2876629 RepID=UPI001CCB383A|nr:hypothetical protein [Mesorhizobium sp. ES1-1]MBZ9676158.1 hypothetical protein [Mesorhizobium sp. ES1-1]